MITCYFNSKHILEIKKEKWRMSLTVYNIEKIDGVVNKKNQVAKRVFCINESNRVFLESMAQLILDEFMYNRKIMLYTL